MQARLFTDLVVSELEAEESAREQEMEQMCAQALRVQRKRSKQKQALQSPRQAVT